VLGELPEEGWNEGFGDVEMRLGMKSYNIGGGRLRRGNCVHEASMMFLVLGCSSSTGNDR
jgi:hypothetical protein